MIMPMIINDQAGLSLLEIVIVGALTSIVIVATLSVIGQGVKFVGENSRTADYKTDVDTIARHLKKHMATGDLRFFAFTGSSVTDQDKFRFFVPQPGVCRDLSTGPECLNSVSFLYVDYDKTTSPTVPITCAYRVAGQDYLLANLNDSSYGVASTTGSAPNFTGFSVKNVPPKPSASGTVQLSAGSVLAALDTHSSAGFLLTAAGNAVLVGDSTTSLDQPCNWLSSLGPPSGECTDIKQTISNKCDNLYAIPVDPFIPKQFFKNIPSSSPVLSTLLTVSAAQPLRILNTRIRSIGMAKDPKLKNASVFGISDCVWDISSAPDPLTCKVPSGLFVLNSIRSRVAETFRYRLSGASQSIRYEPILDGNRQQLTFSCKPASGDCAQLPVTNPGNLPIALPLVSPSVYETLLTLQNTKFSLIKQEALLSIRFFVQRQRAANDQATVAEQNRNSDEEIFDVSFP